MKYKKIKIANNPNTPAEVLVKLSKDEDEDIRIFVAYNPNTPVETLVKLSKDEVFYVKNGVAINTTYQKYIIEQWAEENGYKDLPFTYQKKMFELFNKKFQTVPIYI